MMAAKAPPYHVSAYSFENLVAILVREPDGATQADVEAKPHVNYLHEYLTEIKAATMVVEREYVDRHFLSDFAGHYARCFHRYNQRCARLHFFSHIFSCEEFGALLKCFDADAVRKLHEGYLGFTVIKPLPRTFIGRTCLATYSANADGGEQRVFPLGQPCHANLFGLNLEITSLPFQEQDGDVAACATSALWSAFHATAKRFGHALPSPVEITRAAGLVVSRHSSRMLPNDGLTAEQMAAAISNVGLEPNFLRGEQPIRLLQASAYAYLRGGIPVLMLGPLHDVRGRNGSCIGRHAIVANGYRVNGAPHSASISSPILVSDRLDRLYCHDDAVGPFARLRFNDNKIITSWPDESGERGHIAITPEALLIPLYQTIRIDFCTIYTFIEHLDLFFTNTLRDMPKIEWDIFLTDIVTFRADIAAKPKLTPDLRHSLLCRNLPRHIWRATALAGGVPQLDILFDATDLRQRLPFVDIVGYDHDWVITTADIVARDNFDHVGTHHDVAVVLRALNANAHG